MSPLPVAAEAEVRAAARQLLLRRPRQLAAVLLLHIFATIAGLAGPWLIGNLVEQVQSAGIGVHQTVAALAGFVVLQTALVRMAWSASARLGERSLAELREDFVGNALTLPLADVERAGIGDLVTRTTRDVDVLSRTVRLAAPDSLISLATVVLTLGALVLVSPVLVLPTLVAVPILWVSTRWYLARARPGYLRSGAAYSDLTEGLSETIAGARTVEALGIGQRRINRVNRDIALSYRAERYTLRLRSIYLPIADTAYILPTVVTLIFGGLLYLDGSVSLAAVTAATLYAQQIVDPLDRLLFWMDELQVGGASLARLLGVVGVKEPCEKPELPASDRTLSLENVSFGYRAGRAVLHHVTLHVRPGEHVAIVGPSGAGKSTVGRLLAGIHTPWSGDLSIGGRPMRDVPFSQLRREVALVSQEQHVFSGTLRDNLIIAKPGAADSELVSALEVVGATDWVGAIGLDGEVGSGGVNLLPAQAQQLGLARIVLVDPHTLILDEATSMLAPRAARGLERSLSSVLADRTVISIAHRLHTAHDADRVVVMEDGRITETGSHTELIKSRGTYSTLWKSWNNDFGDVTLPLDAGR